MDLESLSALYPELTAVSAPVRERVQTDIKYAGYLDRQRELVARTAALEATALPPGLD